MKFNQNILPHIVAIIIFAIVTTVFYSPLVFGGKIIDQHDIVRGLGASQEIIDFRNSTGEEALWTNSMFGGMPAYLINMKWSGDLMLYLHRIITIWLPSPAGVMMAGCVSFYLLLLVFKVRPWLAIIGGLAYGLGSFNIISVGAGHMWKVWAIAYMPMVLAGVHLTVREKYLPGFLLTALGLALELRSNHLQITYYLLLLLLIYGATYLYFSIKEGKIKTLATSVGFMVAAALLALGCNFGKIWSVYEYGQYSTRGPSDLTTTEKSGNGLDQEYAFRWSNGIMEPITLLIPNFFGGPSVSSLNTDGNLGKAMRNNGVAPVQIRQQLQQMYTYWGKQPSTAGPSYVGAIVVFLFVSGYFLLPRKDIIWISIGIVVSIVLSWGHNFESFNSFIFDYFPGYNKFRSVSMTLVIALLCIPLAAFLSLEQLLLGLKKPETQKKLLKTAGIVGAILLLAIGYSFIGDFRAAVDDRLSEQVAPWFVDGLRADRAALLRADAFRSLIMVGLMVTAIYFHQKEKLGVKMLLIIAGLLVLFDLWGVDKRYLNADDFIRNTPAGLVEPSNADKAILNDQDPDFRVLSFLEYPWAESRTFNFHKSIGGYHGAKMGRFQELIDGCLDEQFRGVIQNLQSSNLDFSGFNALNMLNTKYLLVGSDENGVVRNNNAFGHAWLASSINTVDNADQELAEVCKLSSASAVVVDKSKFEISSNNFDNSGEVILEQYQPNYLKYRFNNPQSALVVFSEIYYPKGWTATVDGEPVDILRVNYVLRAIEAPAGAHSIEFRFEPAAYHTGNKIMMASSILLILLSAGIAFREWKEMGSHHSE